MIPPEAVLPFALDRSGARDALRQWTSSRWFAPNALKKVTETESAKSTYVPHWTFDARTISQYHGQRGQYYYRTETYTDSDGNRQTRQVRETQWFPASGTVYRDFDDVVVPASSHVTKDRLVALEPWKLNDAVPYEPSYLAGHNALRYDQEPEAGLNTAKEQMSSQIRQDCRADIGGDEQRIHSVNTQYNAVTFKLMLLPVWICSYIFNGKPWQILVNGTTGEVQGSRPYSVWKIIGASVAAVAIIVTIIMLIILSQ